MDDESYAVNTALKTALTDYKTSLISVQGDSIANGDGGSGGTGGSGADTTGDLIHNFTLSGTNSVIYKITGNLSGAKGTVNYDGFTLTQCLKIESGTVISFSTTQDGTLTLVFNDSFNGKININGTSYNATAGILTLSIPAGSYEITKRDVANLYYMSVVYDDTDNGEDTEIHNTHGTELTLYPNPVNDQLFLLTNARIERIEMYNMTGIAIKTREFNEKSVDMSYLSRGTYIIRIFTNQGVFSSIVVKK